MKYIGFKHERENKQNSDNVYSVGLAGADPGFQDSGGRT